MSRRHDLLAQIELAALDPASDITDTLRRCLALGGRTGSTALRDWAAGELKGYSDGDSLPSYRLISAPLVLDGAVPGAIVRAQLVTPAMLPEEMTDLLFEDVRVPMPIAEVLEIVAAGRRSGEDSVSLSVPGGPALVELMNNKWRAGPRSASLYGEPTRSQQIERIYWHVSLSAMYKILDVVRTTLVELVAELRAGMEPGDVLPSHAVTDEAVAIAVQGNRARITINQVSAAERASVIAAGSASTLEPETGVRTVVSWAVALATVVAGVCGVLALL